MLPSHLSGCDSLSRLSNVGLIRHFQKWRPHAFFSPSPTLVLRFGAVAVSLHGGLFCSPPPTCVVFFFL